MQASRQAGLFRVGDKRDLEFFALGAEQVPHYICLHHVASARVDGRKESHLFALFEGFKLLAQLGRLLGANLVYGNCADDGRLSFAAEVIHCDIIIRFRAGGRTRGEAPRGIPGTEFPWPAVASAPELPFLALARRCGGLPRFRLLRGAAARRGGGAWCIF